MIGKLLSPVGLVLSIVPTIAWIFSVYTRFTNNEWFFALGAFFIPPLGAIDGVAMFLGLW